MPRPILIRSDIHPYHISSRCNNKEFFPLPMNEVWQIMLARLKHINREYKVAIHAFVLMGNHFHLLCHTPEANLDKAMHSFLRSTSSIIMSKTRSENHLWGGRYKWSLIDSRAHYFQVYRYIFQNPLRAGIVSKVQDYPYSSLLSEVPFPLHSFLPMAFGGQEGEVQWLNERYEKEEQQLIKLGLRRSQFDINRRKLKTFNGLSLPTDKPVV